MPRFAPLSRRYTGSTAMTHARREWRGLWRWVALVGLVATTSPSLVARDRDGEFARRPRPSTPPTQPPTEVEIQGGTGKVHLEWSAVAGAAGYHVFRGIAGVWSPQPIATVGWRHYKDRGLTDGIVHSYKIAAVNRLGVGPQSREVSATPLAPPTELTALPGQQQITLKWQPSAGATGYIVLRSVAQQHPRPIGTSMSPTFVDSGLSSGTLYKYRVRAVAASSQSESSRSASATPGGSTIDPPTAAPTVSAIGGDGFVDLTWTAVSGATAYKVFKVAAGVPVMPPLTIATSTTYRHQALVNGTSVSYQVAATNTAGDGPLSSVVSATPSAPLVAPTNLTAVGGDATVTLTWAPVAGAASYKVYRGTASNGQTGTALTPDPTAATFVDRAVINGTSYFYKVAAMVGGQESPRSNEASATPSAPSSTDPNTLSAFRLLRQTSWGPKPGDVDRVKNLGAAALVDEQFGMAPSAFPDTLYNESVEAAQEYWMQLALNGPDQLRQRVAWALHKILVVSAADAAVNRTTAIVPYYRILMSGAFGTYRDLLRSITLNAAMGRYLNMLNNRKQTFDANGVATSPPPNENYPRELLQLFAWGTSQLNQDGTPLGGVVTPTYTEADVKALSRILTGWTFGDGNPAVPPNALISSGDYRQPMEPVESLHDRGQKTFMGADFPADVDARAELERVLDVIMGHPNIAPFISRQLIQQLVTSNPRQQYISDIAAVFSSSSGNLAAVVRAILLHDDARGVSPTPTKLSEPVLFAVSMLRGLNAAVTDTPFLSDLTAEMGQNVFFPGSVFSYYSPNFRVPNSGTPPLFGPEFQILTSVTSLERANFVGRLLAGQFGSAVTVDYTPFMNLAATPDELIEHVNQLFLGGRMSDAQRTRIRTAVLTTTDARERVRTVLYVTLIAAQAQVDN